MRPPPSNGIKRPTLFAPQVSHRRIGMPVRFHLAFSNPRRNSVGDPILIHPLMPPW